MYACKIQVLVFSSVVSFFDRINREAASEDTVINSLNFLVTIHFILSTSQFLALCPSPLSSRSLVDLLLRHGDAARSRSRMPSDRRAPRRGALGEPERRALRLHLGGERRKRIGVDWR